MKMDVCIKDVGCDIVSIPRLEEKGYIPEAFLMSQGWLWRLLLCNFFGIL